MASASKQSAAREILDLNQARTNRKNRSSEALNGADVLQKISILNLLQQIASAANESDNLDSILQFTLDRVCAITGWDVGHIWLWSDGQSEWRTSNVWYLKDSHKFESFQAKSISCALKSNIGIPGRVLQDNRAQFFEIIGMDLDPRAESALDAGIQSGYAVPVWGRANILGVIEFFFDESDKGPDPTLMEALSQIGAQVGLVISRLEADAQIRQAELRYRELVERVQAIFWQGTASPLSITFVSAEAEAMLGYAQDFWLQDSENWIRKIHPADKEKTIRKLKGVGPGESIEAVYRMERADGRLVWLRNMVRGMKTSSGAGHIIGIIVDITAQMTVEEDLRNSRAQLRALSARLQAVREEERISIAREVHDELGQLLTVLKIDLTLFRQNFEAGAIEEGPIQDIIEMTRVTDSAIAAVQRIAIELRPMILDELGMMEALEWYAQDFERRTGIECRFVGQTLSAIPDKESATALFRIFQEALTNVARHSQATKVQATIHEDAECFKLAVRDNGIGIRAEDLNDTRSLGLIGMRERAVVLDGDVTIEKAPDQGTIVSVRIPRPQKRGGTV